ARSLPRSGVGRGVSEQRPAGVSLVRLSACRRDSDGGMDRRLDPGGRRQPRQTDSFRGSQRGLLILDAPLQRVLARGVVLSACPLALTTRRTLDERRQRALRRYYFDTAHNFAGCIASLHEGLPRQGLFEVIWCLDADENLSPGQME